MKNNSKQRRQQRARNAWHGHKMSYLQARWTLRQFIPAVRARNEDRGRELEQHYREAMQRHIKAMRHLEGKYGWTDIFEDTTMLGGISYHQA